MDGVTVSVTFLATLGWGRAGAGPSGSVSASPRSCALRRPHVAELGQLPGTDTFRNLARYEGLTRVPGMAVVRVDGPLYFATHNGWPTMYSVWPRNART